MTNNPSQSEGVPRKRHSINILDSSELAVGWIPGRVHFPDHSISLIAKGVYSLRQDEVVAPTEDAECELSGPIQLESESGASLAYESDFAFFKPKTDVVLVGSCHAPDGKPTRSCRVTFGVGDWSRALQVVGDRFWDKGISGAIMTEPIPFTSMPMRFENALGGEGFEHNPVGKGLAAIDCEDGGRRIPLPNIEDPRQMISSPTQRPAPACFGPLAADWRPRCEDRGTYDAEWLESRWPWLPADFDWRFFNAAPTAQQLDGYLRGDELITLENLVRGQPNFKTRLPGLSVRALVERRRPGERAAIEEVPMHLDTLWIDTEAEKLVLVWRGYAQTVSESCTDIDALYTFTERLEEPAASVEQAYRALTRSPEILAEPPELEVSATGAEAGIDEDETEFKKLEAADPEHQLLIDNADSVAYARSIYREQLIRLGQDPAPAATWTPSADPESIRLQTEIEARIAAEFPEDDEPALDRAACIKRAAETGSLAELDLRGIDLSDCDLAQVDFSGALLGRASFTGTRLAGATFLNADLSGAVFDNADLAGMDARKADFTGARMLRADLSDARLANARFCDAVMREARMLRAQAPRTDFSRADLVDANLEGGDFSEADFSECPLDGTVLTNAVLTGAHLERSSGTGSVFSGAEMTGAVFAEGCRFADSKFRGVTADESIWEGADLMRCDFSGAGMRGADFTLATFYEVVLRCCDLAFARFDDAVIASCDLEHANLFQACLERTDLGHSNMRSVNLYEAETRDARIESADLHGANLKMTKLAWQAPLR